MSFKKIEYLSDSLNKGIIYFAERTDMNARDRELFYDIIKFAYNEGKLKGKEEYLNEQTNNE